MQTTTQTPRMTLAEHTKLGRQLKAIRRQLMSTRLPYPKCHPAQRKLTRAIAAIDSLKCSLDGQAGRDLGHEFSVSLYYGEPDS